MNSATSVCQREQKCYCPGGKPVPGPSACTGERFPYKCASCNDGWTLSSDDTKCEPACIANRMYDPVCCDGTTHSNPSVARCAKCYAYKRGACEAQCGWANHDETTCNKAPGCQWSGTACSDEVFVRPVEQSGYITCRDNACDNLKDTFNFDAFKSDLDTCHSDNSLSAIAEAGYRQYRFKCGLKKDKRMGATFKSIMGYGSGAGKTEMTNKDKVNDLREKWQEANTAMAQSCFTCITADLNTEATCITNALAAFKVAFDDDFASLPDTRNKPTDERLKSSMRGQGMMFASKERREVCYFIEEREKRRKCEETANSKMTAAGCRKPSTRKPTEVVKDREEQTKNVLGKTCTKSSSECFAEKRAAYAEESGEAEVSNTAVRVLLKDVAAEKATDAMGLCAADIDFTADAEAVVKPARAACLQLAKEEYIKYDPIDKEKLKDPVMGAILRREAMKKASKMMQSLTSGTIEEKLTQAKEEMTRYMGKTTDEIDADDFKQELRQTAASEAAETLRTCMKAENADRAVCLHEYKEDYASLTGTSQADVSDTDIKHGEAKKKNEMAMKAIKALAEDRRASSNCAKTKDECKMDERKKKREEMEKITKTPLDDTDVERIEMSAIHEEMRRIRKQCYLDRTPRRECLAAMKEARQAMSGTVITDVEVDQEVKEADDRNMAEFAKSLTGTAEEKKAKKLAKLKEIKGDTTLTEVDMRKQESRMEQKEVEDLLDTVDEDADTDQSQTKAQKRAARFAAMREKIAKIRGGVTPSDKEVEKIKRNAETKRAAKEMMAAMRADATNGRSKFMDSLRRAGVNTDDPEENAKRRIEAKDAMVQDVVDAEIDITNATKTEQGRQSKIQMTRDRMKAAYGRNAEKWEAQRELARISRKKMAEEIRAQARSRGMDQGADTRTVEEKQADNKQLVDKYQKATGEKAEVYEIKQQAKDAVTEGEEVGDIMADETKTEEEKTSLVQAKMKELTGERPSEVEMTTMKRRIAQKKMMDMSKVRSEARESTAKKTKEELKKEWTARRAAYAKYRGRQASSDAEVKKSFARAVRREAYSDYRACINSGKSRNACGRDTLAKISKVDDDVSEDDIQEQVKGGEMIAASTVASECKKSGKTFTECRQKMAKYLKESRGETKDVPRYESAKTLRDGAKKMLGPMISECKDLACKEAAKEKYQALSLNDEITDVEFEEEVEEAAASEGLEMSKGCDKETEDCGKILMDSYAKARGKTEVKKAEAVTAVKHALCNSVAEASASCTKSPTACRDRVRNLIKRSKSWDTRGKNVSVSEVESQMKRGAAEFAKKTYRECFKLARAEEIVADQKTKMTECRAVFRSSFEQAYPKSKEGSTKEQTAVLDRATTQAQVTSVSTRLEAETQKAKESGERRTRQQIVTIFKAAIIEGAPVDNEEELDDPMSQEKMLDEAGLQKVRDAAFACIELGDECSVDKTVGAKITDTQDTKKISLATEMQKGNGQALMGKTPTKEDEEKVSRKAPRSGISKAARDCVDAGTVREDMSECIRGAMDVAKMIRGDDKNEAKDKKDAMEDDAIEEIDGCMKSKGSDADFNRDCKDTYKNRLKRTGGTMPSDKDEKHALIKKTASELDDKKMVCGRGEGLPLVGTESKEREQKARDELKKRLKNRGVPTREVDLTLQKGAEINAIQVGADAIKAGKTDEQVVLVIKEALEKDPDAPDFTAEKKKTMVRCSKGVAKGENAGDLKFKPTKSVNLCVCVTDPDKTITEKEIKSLITNSAAASKVVNMDEKDTKDGPKMIKAPVKNSVTKRTCGTVEVRPLPGKTTKEVKTEVDKLIKTVERRLRESGRRLEGSSSTSSSENEEIVPGDDDSEAATDPASKNSGNNGGNKGGGDDDRDDVVKVETPAASNSTLMETVTETISQAVQDPGILVAVGCLAAAVVLLGIGFAVKHHQHKKTHAQVKRLTMVNKRLSIGQMQDVSFVNPVVNVGPHGEYTANASMERLATKTGMTKMTKIAPPPPPEREPGAGLASKDANNGW